MNPNSIHSILRAAAEALLIASATPHLDAELLLAHTLHLTRAQILARGLDILPPPAQLIFSQLIARRRGGEPVAYLIGYQEFWSLSFAVTADTLIPRPETELLVELLLQKFPADDVMDIADWGTGCGAIALALASERPRWSITAIDNSVAALAVAQDNARRLRIPNIFFILNDWRQALVSKQWQAIVSNPPYIVSGDAHLLHGDIRFEPITALDGGKDGLRDLRRIIITARDYLLPGGWLLLEHGFDQGSAVRELLLTHGYTHVATHNDLSGQERATLGQWQSL
jgi:release factor glutamine methyltransferase